MRGVRIRSRSLDTTSRERDQAGGGSTAAVAMGRGSVCFFYGIMVLLVSISRVYLYQSQMHTIRKSSFFRIGFSSLQQYSSGAGVRARGVCEGNRNRNGFGGVTDQSLQSEGNKKGFSTALAYLVGIAACNSTRHIRERVCGIGFGGRSIRFSMSFRANNSWANTSRALKA